MGKAGKHEMTPVCIQAHDSPVQGRLRNVMFAKKVASYMKFVPIGPSQGVGIVFGWKLPSFAAKIIKSKDFMIVNVPKYIEGTV